MKITINKKNYNLIFKHLSKISSKAKKYNALLSRPILIYRDNCIDLYSTDLDNSLRFTLRNKESISDNDKVYPLNDFKFMDNDNLINFSNTDNRFIVSDNIKTYKSKDFIPYSELSPLLENRINSQDATSIYTIDSLNNANKFIKKYKKAMIHSSKYDLNNILGSVSVSDKTLRSSDGARAYFAYHSSQIAEMDKNNKDDNHVNIPYNVGQFMVNLLTDITKNCLEFHYLSIFKAKDKGLILASYEIGTDTITLEYSFSVFEQTYPDLIEIVPIKKQRLDIYNFENKLASKAFSSIKNDVDEITNMVKLSNDLISAYNKDYDQDIEIKLKSEIDYSLDVALNNQFLLDSIKCNDLDQLILQCENKADIVNNNMSYHLQSPCLIPTGNNEYITLMPLKAF